MALAGAQRRGLLAQTQLLLRAARCASQNAHQSLVATTEEEGSDAGPSGTGRSSSSLFHAWSLVAAPACSTGVLCEAPQFHQPPWHQLQPAHAFSTSSAACSTSPQGKVQPGLKTLLPTSPFNKARLGAPVPKLVLYRGAGMLLFRFLVRVKVFQLLGVLTATVLLTGFMGETTPSPREVGAASAIILGCVVTSYCLWFYSSRYVGELSLLLPHKRVARFSTLDFWGNRQDVDVPLERLDPPFRGRSVAEVRSIASSTLMPLEVRGDRQYYISVRHGQLLQKDVLQKICYGTWLTELEAEGQASGSGEVEAPGAAAAQPAAASAASGAEAEGSQAGEGGAHGAQGQAGVSHTGPGQEAGKQEGAGQGPAGRQA